jgi:ABC-type lipoprotein release transport system permease subunit
MLKLAWRNIWRKRGRSFFTALAVALVVIFTTLQSGLTGAITNALFTSLISTGGHIQIHPENYRDAKDFGDTLIRNVGQVEEKLSSALPANTELVTVLQTGGLLEGSSGRSRGIGLIGVAQPANLRESFVEDYLAEGKFPEDGDIESIALGVNLADSLRVTIGDTVYMYASNTEGYGASAYTVIGLLDIPGSQSLAYTSLLAAQELAAPDSVSRIELHFNDFTKLTDDAKLPALQTQITDALGSGYSIEKWDEVNPGMRGFIDTQGATSVVFQLVFFILAGLVVTNTIYLSIIERIREFGVMMALGLSRWKVMLMVFYESLSLCGVGAAIGGVIVSLVLWRTSQGIQVAAFETFFEGLPNTLYTSVTSSSILIILAFVVITGILAALWPARTAAKLEPVEAMRFTA